jgi:hypothetical protein
LSALKDKVSQYEKYMKEFRTQEQKFKEEFVINERIGAEFKQLKIKFNELED